MAYKLKTLVVFDTNSLRSTEANEVAYSFFAFGRPFQEIENFILENKLKEDIHLAIPAWAIEELKDQKHRQYQSDLDKFQKLAERLSKMPHFQSFALPETAFDCATFIAEKADEYLAVKKIKLFEIREELSDAVFQSMKKRVMKDQDKKQPFAHSGKYKDAGFKDNIVWESIMHFEGIADFDKVVFLTKDTDYNNCQVEFKDKWNKHISIQKDENSVIAEIRKDYENYIENREIYDYANKEYFTDYLTDNLAAKSEIIIDDHNYKIEKFEIVDKCKDVERMPQNEDFEENLIIHSTIKIFFTQEGVKKEQLVNTKTTLADDTSRDFVEINFEPELL